MDKTKIIVWQRLDNVGIEYLQLIESDEAIVADSVVIGVDDNNTYFRLRYQVQCDAHYHVRRVDHLNHQ